MLTMINGQICEQVTGTAAVASYLNQVAADATANGVGLTDYLRVRASATPVQQTVLDALVAAKLQASRDTLTHSAVTPRRARTVRQWQRQQWVQITHNWLATFAADRRVIAQGGHDE